MSDKNLDTQIIDKKFPNQVTGNIGLYYACYELSKKGWNVLPTSRNTKGVDIIIFDQTGTKKLTIQVKSLTKKAPVPFGSNIDHMIADFVIICRSVLEKEPEIFIATQNEMKTTIHKGVKDGKVSYWWEPKDYEPFRNLWGKIGVGF
ncbi:MAG: hypothetical protein QXW91_05045 [Candidatus Nitrosotenuis sp.]